MICFMQHKAVGRFSDSPRLYELSLRNHIFLMLEES